MAIRVVIQRQCAPGNERRVQELLLELRRQGLGQAGYISGETLFDVDDPRTVVVFSSWSGRDDWERWQRSDARQTIEARLRDLLATPESVQVLREPTA